MQVRSWPTGNAAKNTADLIEGTIQKVRDVSKLVSEARANFDEVSEKAVSVGDLVEEITAASGEQSQRIGQVNQSVTEIDRITQQNAANAEASSTSSVEMSSQAKKMQSMVGELVVFVNGSGNKGEKKESRNLHQKTTKRKAKQLNVEQDQIRKTCNPEIPRRQVHRGQYVERLNQP